MDKDTGRAAAPDAAALSQAGEAAAGVPEAAAPESPKVPEAAAPKSQKSRKSPKAEVPKAEIPEALKAKVADLFARHPGSDGFFFTSDGLPFFREADAILQSNFLKDKEIIHITREQYATTG